MKQEELFEALEDIDPAIVKKARDYRKRKKNVWMKWIAAAACMAMIVGIIAGVPAIKKDGQGEKSYPLGVMKVMAAYPESVAKDISAENFIDSEEYWSWWSENLKNVHKSRELQSEISGFYTEIMSQLLISEDENTVCSPISIYIACAMLAEVSDGNTRSQLLDMLGVENVDKLRENVSSLWESNYVDTPVLKSLLANSLWLDGDVKYNDITLNRLAEKYYASTFSGMPGSEEMNNALQKWTDDNTGGLLSEYTKNMSMDKDTVLEILSSVYYHGMWSDEFLEEKTEQAVFHGTLGDTTVNMMKKTDMIGVYQTDSFTATSLDINDSGSMYFILPNDNEDVNSLATDSDILKIFRYNEEDKNWFVPVVHLSVPKFKVSAKTDLLEAMMSLGVTDALDYTIADFTPLTTDKKDLYLSKAEHAATIEIDEHGVTGAAYTELGIVCGAAIPQDEIDFTLNRPFMFIVTGKDKSILFAGVVRNIE